MPVDNDNIKSHIDSLQNKENELRAKSRELRDAGQALQSILQTQREVPDPNDASKRILVDVDIMDERAGKKITDVRRQEIYDFWIAKADTLLI